MYMYLRYALLGLSLLQRGKHVKGNPKEDFSTMFNTIILRSDGAQKACAWHNEVARSRGNSTDCSTIELEEFFGRGADPCKMHPVVVARLAVHIRKWVSSRRKMGSRRGSLTEIFEMILSSFNHLLSASVVKELFSTEEH